MGLIKDITGVVLAGGQSSRFGRNKALATWQGKTLIQHVRDNLAEVFSDCLLSTNFPEQYAFLKMPTVLDRFRDMGPLAGIHAALRYTEKPWIFVVGCDMPAVTPEIIIFLCGFTGEKYEAVIPWLQTGPEPVCGLYHKTALPEIEMQLRNKKTQLKELLGRLSVRKIAEEELQKVAGARRVFVNVNREQDLTGLS